MIWMFTPVSGHGASSGSKSMKVAARVAERRRGGDVDDERFVHHSTVPARGS
jgi:hypothetical protein